MIRGLSWLVCRAAYRESAARDDKYQTDPFCTELATSHGLI